jgi:hypothetical protein
MGSQVGHFSNSPKLGSLLREQVEKVVSRYETMKSVP